MFITYVTREPRVRSERFWRSSKSALHPETAARRCQGVLPRIQGHLNPRPSQGQTIHPARVHQVAGTRRRTRWRTTAQLNNSLSLPVMSCISLNKIKDIKSKNILECCLQVLKTIKNMKNISLGVSHVICYLHSLNNFQKPWSLIQMSSLNLEITG